MNFAVGSGSYDSTKKYEPGCCTRAYMHVVCVHTSAYMCEEEWNWFFVCLLLCFFGGGGWGGNKLEERCAEDAITFYQLTTHS